MNATDSLRQQLIQLLEWEQAHTGIDRAVAGFPAGSRGVRPAGLPHSAWELLEHIRLGQHDILEFCRNPEYVELKWPDDYWPPASEPPSAEAWDASAGAIVRERVEFQQLLVDPDIDPLALVPTATDPAHTYLREVLLAVDHAAYHTGQLMVVRQLLEYQA